MKDMLCGIQGFSPTGLTGVLPAGTAAAAAAGAGSSPSAAAAETTCTTPRLGLFAYKGVMFQPLVIPVVFHCECGQEVLLCDAAVAVLCCIVENSTLAVAAAV
jgi:hypothetical protein